MSDHDPDVTSSSEGSSSESEIEQSTQDLANIYMPDYISFPGESSDDEDSDNQEVIDLTGIPEHEIAANMIHSPRMRAFFEDLQDRRRGVFMRDLRNKYAAVKEHQSIASTLKVRHTRAFSIRQQRQEARKLKLRTRNYSRHAFRVRQDIINEEQRALEVEGVANEHIESWEEYLTDWVELMGEIVELWENIFDYLEEGVFRAISHPDRSRWEGDEHAVPDRAAELYVELKGLQRRFNAVRDASNFHGQRVMHLA